MTKEQNEIYSLLEQFAQICKAHNLTYWLDGGTLLGAVRHHGFIPWDDDVDVAMPEEDFLKFLQLENAFPEGILLQTEKTDENYPFLFAKICNVKIPFETGNKNGPWGVYIDVFPIISAGKGLAKNRVCFKLVQAITYALQIKKGWAPYIPYKKQSIRFIFSLIMLCPKFLLCRIRTGLVGIIKLFGKGNSYSSPASGHTIFQDFWPREWCDKRDELVFERSTFPVPAGRHEYLTRCYGNYMELPPENERRSSHKFLT